MRVVYAHVRIFPESLESIREAAPEMAVTDAGPDAYWSLLRDLWRSGDDFCIVEQDMVVPPGALASLEACPELWCGVPYELYGVYGVWHGVTRYRGALTWRLPHLPDEIEHRSWEQLDSAWINHLRDEGYAEAHWHWPAARHLRFTPDLEQSRFFNCVRCGANMKASNAGVCPRCGWIFAPLMPLTPTAAVR